jgi:hypothetical protein
MAKIRPSYPPRSSIMNERYIEYLNSKEWKAKLKAVKERCSNICERCHRYLVDDVHHLTYERVYNESLEDLQGLCAGCHEFLHSHTGIDPLKKSIRVTVSRKIIRFLDSEARKFRHVKIASLPPERFRWFRWYDGDKLIKTGLENSQLGQFDVPMEVFLDEQGKPVFDPSKWEEYRVASRIANRWYSARREPRVKREQSMEARFAEQEKRKKLEEKRLNKNPEHYTSFEHVPRQTSTQAKALLRKYPRVVDHGQEGTILRVRETKTMGVVLDLEQMTANGWIHWSIHEADRQLAEGKIVLDSNRNLWVVRD